MPRGRSENRYAVKPLIALIRVGFCVDKLCLTYLGEFLYAGVRFVLRSFLASENYFLLYKQSFSDYWPRFCGTFRRCSFRLRCLYQPLAPAFWLCGAVSGVLGLSGLGGSNRHACPLRHPPARHRLYLHHGLLCQGLFVATGGSDRQQRRTFVFQWTGYRHTAGQHPLHSQHMYQLHRTVGLALGCQHAMLQRTGAQQMQYGDVEVADIRGYSI